MESTEWTLALMIATAIGLPAPLAAQSPEESVLEIVTRLFDGMRAADSAAVRATFHESARLVATGGEGEDAVRFLPVDAFVRAVGNATGEWDERFWDPEVRIDGDLATVWTEYAFYLDGDFSHCGVDAFVLARTGEGWKIVSIADTRRTEGCDVPER